MWRILQGTTVGDIKEGDIGSLDYGSYRLCVWGA